MFNKIQSVRNQALKNVAYKMEVVSSEGMASEEMQKNYAKIVEWYGGEGTALFVDNAIQIYCDHVE